MPRPEIVKMSSIDIWNAWSTARTGCGMKLSRASISSQIGLHSSLSELSDDKAFVADPRMIGVVSPGNS
ncbi:hypothetical protein D3C83_136390 [compost metagenome]